MRRLRPERTLLVLGSQGLAMVDAPVQLESAPFLLWIDNSIGKGPICDRLAWFVGNNLSGPQFIRRGLRLGG